MRTSGVSTRLCVLLGAAGVVAIALIVRWAMRSDSDLAGLSPEAARIERLRRRGDLDALSAETRNPDTGTAVLAAQALARMGPSAAGHVEAALADARPRVREAAAIALGRVAGRRKAGRLAQLLREDDSANVRAAAARALNEARAYEEMDALLQGMSDDSPLVRRWSGQAVEQITGMSFGYDPEAPAPQRQRAITQVRDLWPSMLRVIREREGGEQGPER